VAENLRRLHNEELHNLHASPNIIKVIKPRGIRWLDHVARMGDEKRVQGFWSGKLKT